MARNTLCLEETEDAMIIMRYQKEIMAYDDQDFKNLGQ
jgi:hypothetical protein